MNIVGEIFGNLFGRNILMKLRTYLNTLLPSWLEEISQHGWRKSHSNLAQFLVPKDDKRKLVKNKAVMGAITNTWISNKF